MEIHETAYHLVVEKCTSVNRSRVQSTCPARHHPFAVVPRHFPAWPVEVVGLDRQSARVLERRIVDHVEQHRVRLRRHRAEIMLPDDFTMRLLVARHELTKLQLRIELDRKRQQGTKQAE